MKEATLKEFFEGKTTEANLLSELACSITKNDKRSCIRIENMEAEFTVEPSHLIRVCNSVLSGKLSPEHLESIGFCLQASDTFEWDADTESGGRVADIVFYMSCPEINYELSRENIELFKFQLQHGGNPFASNT